MIRLELPIYFQKKGKLKLLSMNWYRNAHFMEQNKIKKWYKMIILSKLEKDNVKIKSVKMEYELYYKNSGCDLMNVGAIVDKFVMDALQEAGIIENDNVRFYKESAYKAAGQDKENPRIIIKIMEG